MLFVHMQAHKLFLKMVSNRTDKTQFSTCCTSLQHQTEMHEPKYARLKYTCYFHFPTWDTKRAFSEFEMLEYLLLCNILLGNNFFTSVSPSTPRLYFTLSRKAAKPQLHTHIPAILIINCIFLIQERSFKTEITFLHILLYCTGTKK